MGVAWSDVYRPMCFRAEDIMLPPRLVRLRQDRMDEKEEDFYQVHDLMG